MSSPYLAAAAEPIATRKADSKPLDRFPSFLLACWRGIRHIFAADGQRQKQLRLCETAQLGEKRFVAVIQVDQERFLIGGASNSVVLLSRLSDHSSSPDLPTHSERSSQAQ